MHFSWHVEPVARSRRTAPNLNAVLGGGNGEAMTTAVAPVLTRRNRLGRRLDGACPNSSVNEVTSRLGKHSLRRALLPNQDITRALH